VFSAGRQPTLEVHARHAAARELNEEVGVGLAPGDLRYLWRLDTTAPTRERYRVWGAGGTTTIEWSATGTN